MDYVSIGIYKIENLVNGKIYIGQSVNMKSRFKAHINKLKINKHENNYLQKAFNKYGEENFKFKLLEELKDIDSLTIREQYWIDFYNSMSPNGYNIRFAGDSSPITEESKEKMSLAKKGIVISEEHKEKLRIAQLKRYENKNEREKISKATKGKNNPMYGKHHSEETKKKVSEANKGRKSYNKGKKVSEEKRLKSVGENNAMAKLTEQDVKTIRELNKNSDLKKIQIANMFNIKYGTLWAIVNYKIWREVI